MKNNEKKKIVLFCYRVYIIRWWDALNPVMEWNGLLYQILGLVQHVADRNGLTTGWHYNIMVKHQALTVAESDFVKNDSGDKGIFLKIIK